MASSLRNSGNGTVWSSQPSSSAQHPACLAELERSFPASVYRRALVWNTHTALPLTKPNTSIGCPRAGGRKQLIKALNLQQELGFPMRKAQQSACQTYELYKVTSSMQLSRATTTLAACRCIQGQEEQRQHVMPARQPSGLF